MCVVNGNVAKSSLSEVGLICGWEDRALQECNLSAQPSVDGGCIRERAPQVIWDEPIVLGSSAQGWPSR
jgi:hypothetical protein